MKAVHALMTIAALSLSTCVAAPAFADEVTASKQFVQMLSPLVQLNRNCSAGLIQSKLGKDGKVSTLFLTAKHCTDGSKLIQEVYIPVYKNNRIVKEDLYRAEVFKESYKDDLALVKLTDEDTVFGNVAKIAFKPTLYEGEEVWTVGYPVGRSRTITTGTFGNLESLPFPNEGTHTEYYRATPAIIGGNSGGMLFHLNPVSKDYEVIGVTTAGLKSASWISYYAPLEDIVDFLKGPAPEAVGIDPAAPTIKTPGVN